MALNIHPKPIVMKTYDDRKEGPHSHPNTASPGANIRRYHGALAAIVYRNFNSVG
jgi:hypothetical protein